MPYSELIKSFDRIRDYLRDFYVYGFKRREEFDTKSARGYDNERRRVESWLSDYMSFRRDADGKTVFISIDSREIVHNPLYKAFKTKSFTSIDIMLNFMILDVLSDGAPKKVNEIIEELESEHLFIYEDVPSLDESTVRLKLREYSNLGILASEKRNNKLYFKLSSDNVPLTDWADALDFFSEEDPLGIVGSYLLDKQDDSSNSFRFKHHYILHALESEILHDLFLAIYDKMQAELSIFKPNHGPPKLFKVIPFKIYVSAQSGRQYLLAYSFEAEKVQFFRLDTIKTVKLRKSNFSYNTYKKMATNFEKHLWGVSTGDGENLEHVDLTLYASPDEKYIVDRLERERRNGTVESIGNDLYRFTADVYDSAEMLPWIRTFIGRIISFKCSNESTRETFISDLDAMFDIYGRKC